jgi:hypothetical protein
MMFGKARLWFPESERPRFPANPDAANVAVSPSHADYSYLMNHRPLWISNFIEPSSRILNSRDWQDSSFEILARLMISKTLSGFSRSALRIFSRSPIIRFAPFLHAGLARSCRQIKVLTEYWLFTKPLNAPKTTFANWLETSPW